MFFQNPFFLMKYCTPPPPLCSQHISQQVSRLLLELEEAQSFSFLQQTAEEEEQKERAENMRRFITTDNTIFNCQRKPCIQKAVL